MSRPTDVGSVKEGQYIIIDSEPCRIVEYEKSKPGKHGSAKARIVAIGVFDEVKRSIVSPVDGRIEVPNIEKRTGQAVSVSPEAVQFMDLETYEIFEAPPPQEEDLKGKIASGTEVEYWKIMERIRIVRIKTK